MTWVRLDDNFPDHPKIAELPDGAFRLHIAGLCYCSRNLTDGRIPPGMHRRLIDGYRPTHLKALLKVGVWREEMDESHWIHDYLEYQPSAHDVRLAIESRRTAGLEGNHVRWHVRRGVVDLECELCRDPP